MAEQDSGGGGGGSSGGGSSGGSSRLPVGAIERIAAAVVRDLVPNVILRLNGFARALLRNPQKVILGVVVAFFVNEILVPIFTTVVSVGFASIRAIGVLFIGRDLTFGTGGSLGLAELPLAGMVLTFNALTPVVSALIGAIQAFNGSVASIASSAGLAGPAIGTALAVAEIGIAVYVLYTATQLINVPLISVSGIARTGRGVVETVVGVFR